MSKEICKGVLFGIAVGDALGVPVEFLDRKVLLLNPVTDMTGFGTHNQPAGTWSDDSSLTFCLAESLFVGYDLNDQARRFINWYEHAYWTPRESVFDVGIATSGAIWRLKMECPPHKPVVVMNVAMATDLLCVLCLYYFISKTKI